MPPSMGWGRRELLRALGQVLQIRRSELGRTLLLTSIAIVLGCGLYSAFNGTQAIFLTRAGPPAYPAFFIVLALTVWPALAAQAAAARRWGPAGAFRHGLLLNAIIPLPVYAAYALDENRLVSFFALVVYSVSFEVLMLQFWAYAGQHFNLLEAKRAYPVIAAGSGLGYIFAGAVTTLVATVTGRPEGLLFAWSAGALASWLIASRAGRGGRRPAVAEEVDSFLAEEDQARAPVGLLGTVREALRYLRASRLVLALVLLGAVLLVVVRISDYLVAVVFVASTRNVAELTVLLGNAWMLSYVIQLALGLWLTPWLLARAGVRNAILALPIALLAGFVLVALAPGLGTALVLFVVRNGIQTGVDDPARNVLDSALPEQVRPRLAVLHDNLVLPGSAAVTGLLLLVVSVFTGSASAALLTALGSLAAAGLLAAALSVRSLYVSAVFQRLRSHTLALGDLELALGRPGPEEVGELRTHLASPDQEVSRFAAAALGRLSGSAFGELASDLLRSNDPELRRLAFQPPPDGEVGTELVEIGVHDPDPWVAAAAAVRGRRSDVLARLAASDQPAGRAAATWAAASTGDQGALAAALADPDPEVRREAIRGFARLKGEVAGAELPLLACLRDGDAEVRRDALREALRWAPPAARREEFAEALLVGLRNSDPVTRQLAGEALSIHFPDRLVDAFGLLEGEPMAATAALEAIFRSGRADLLGRATAHLEGVLAVALRSAAYSRRLAQPGPSAASGAEDLGRALLRIALDDDRRQAIEVCLAGLRSLHFERGFSRVERGLRSADPAARAVATETLLNFGPPRLAEPLARLLDPESFEAGPARPLTEAEVKELTSHPEEWVRRAAEAVHGSTGESMKDLVALKKVPLFANLSLEQLAGIDRLMVTRHYLAGEPIFRWGDLSSELYVVLEGEVRIHRDTGRHQVTLARLGPNSFMGEMAPFTEEPRSAGAEAVVPTTVRVLRKDRLGAILHEHPEVLLEVIRNLSARLVVANEQLEQAAAVPPTTPADGAPEGPRRSG